MRMHDVSCEDIKIAYMWDRPVGYVYLIKDHVAGIGIVKDHRRKGVGSALLSEALRCLSSRLVKEAVLGVNKRNEPAVNFFRKHGFQELKRSAFMKCRIS